MLRIRFKVGTHSTDLLTLFVAVLSAVFHGHLNCLMFACSHKSGQDQEDKEEKKCYKKDKKKKKKPCEFLLWFAIMP